jgi:mycofactocin system glycosyltransferase
VKSAKSASDEKMDASRIFRRNNIQETAALPGDFCIALDHDAVIAGDGSTIRGGSPARLLRLTSAGGNILNAIARGDTVAEIERMQRGAGVLIRRLINAGLAHPVPPETPSEKWVQVVIPVRNRPDHLRELVAWLHPRAAPVVVDDASDDDTAAVARALGCAVVALERRRGPSSARNAGWRATDAPLIAFIDSDCRPGPGTLDRLAAHFDDPNVGAAAPRIRPKSDGRDGSVQRYESCRSSEDLGPWPALVRPASKVAYVPTVLLVVRRAALMEIEGFDEGMSLGEDVDFVWRLIAARWDVRYDPTVHAVHDHRRSLAPFLLRKFAYGSAAGALERRHRGWVASPRVPLLDFAAWLLCVAWPFWTPVVLALLASAYLLESKSPRPGPNWRGALRRVLVNGGDLADAIVRTWLPLGVAASLFFPRFGVLLAAGALYSCLLERRRRRCRLDPLRYVAIRLLDDASYGLGVWWGCLRHGSVAPLIPKLALPWRRVIGAAMPTDEEMHKDA